MSCNADRLKGVVRLAWLGLAVAGAADAGPIRYLTGHSGWYIAEVDLNSSSIRVEAALANNGAGGYQTVPAIAAARGADLGIVADYSCGSGCDNTCGGVCCGKAYQANGSGSCAESLIWVNGTERSNFGWVQAPQYRTAIGFNTDDRPYIALGSEMPGEYKRNLVSAGPWWLHDGQWRWGLTDQGSQVMFPGPPAEVFGSSAANWNNARPLSTIAYNADRSKMWFVTSYVNKTPDEMRAKLQELGAHNAIRCDCGGSASFYASSDVDNTSGISYGSRPLPNALLVFIEGGGGSCDGSDNAAYVSETIPDGTDIQAGAVFTKTWTVRNTGSSTWTRDCSFKLAFDGGEQFGAAEFTDMEYGDSIGPNQTKTWSLTMTAPTSPGTYRGYWKMDRHGTARFGDRLWVEIDVVGSPDPCSGTDGAEYVSESAPYDGDNVNAGATFTKSWTIKNTGTATWRNSCNHKWAFDGGERFGAAEYTDVGGDVAPGSSKTFTLTMTAPSTPGLYRGYWKMDRYGTGRFGDRVWVEVNVIASDPCGGTDNALYESESAPQDGDPVQAGQVFTKSWTIKNTGTATWRNSCNHKWAFDGGERFGAAEYTDVGGDVAPGSSKTFSLTMTAPSTSGLVRGYWRMDRYGTGRFGDRVWVEVDVQNPCPAGTDSAAFVSETGPADGTAVTQGQVVVKGWTLRNSGDTTWRKSCGHRFAFVDGTTFGAPAYLELGDAETVAPGQSRTWSVSLTVPATSGTVRTDWRMERQGVRFGDQVWTEWNVVSPCSGGADGATFESESSPLDGEAMPTNTAFAKSWTMRNSGTSAWTRECAYRFAFDGGATLGGPAYLELNPGERIEPGQSRTWTANLASPATAGVYRGYWRMDRGGVRFGDQVWVDIVAVASNAVVDGFDFPLDPRDGSAGRPPDYADYNANNSYLTQWSGCYGTQLANCQHAGEDWFADAGDPVYAVADGRVALSRDANYPGYVVVIEHTLPLGQSTPWTNRTICSMYGHLAAADRVSEGAQVTRGQMIGRIYDWGSNSHLHFEMRRWANMNSAPASAGGCDFCRSWYGPGYTAPGCHPDLFGYTEPQAWIDAHRPAGACEPDAYEPNDTRATAFDRTASPGVALSAGAGVARQEGDDWYRIVAPHPWTRLTATCSFTHAQGDIDLALHDAEGTLRAYSDSINDGEALTYEAGTAGDFYLRVYYDNACNAYDLRWDREAVDRDGDSLPDWWEAAHFAGATNAAPGLDDDGDGLTAREEWIAGTDPRAASSVLAARVDEPAAGVFRLAWPSQTGRSYRVFRAQRLDAPAWEPVTNVPATPPTNAWTPPIGNAAQYFRIGVRQEAAP